MQLEKLSDNWLFQRHDQRKIKAWLRQLRYFYFKRAWGGHANDGDEFQAAFSFTDRQDLINKGGQLGLTLNTIPEDFPRPVTGQPYTADEYDKFKNEIKQFTDLEQPGHAVIFGHKAFIWVHNHSIHITISGTLDNNRYEVTEDDLNVCIELEKQFDRLGWKKTVDKSLEESVCCISQAKYPELYEEETIEPHGGLPKRGNNVHLQ